MMEPLQSPTSEKVSVQTLAFSINPCGVPLAAILILWLSDWVIGESASATVRVLDCQGCGKEFPDSKAVAVAGHE